MRELLVVLIGRVLAVAIALLGLRLSTTFLAPAEYGVLALLQTLQLLAIFFLTNPVVQYLNRKLHEWSAAGQLVHRLRLYLLYVNGCSLVAAAAALAWQRSGEAAADALSFAVIFLGVLALAWGPVLSSFLNLLGNRIASITLMTASGLMGLGLAALLAWLSPGGLNWFAGLVVGNALAGLLAYRMLLANIPPLQEASAPPPGERAEALRFIVPLAVSAAFMWFLVAGYRLVFDLVWGAALLGYAAVGLGVATQLWAVSESLATQYLQPYLYRRMAEGQESGDRGACSDYVNVIGPLYLGFSALVAVNAPLAYGLLVADGYHGGLVIFMIAIYVDLLRVLTNAFCMPAHASKDARLLIWSYLTAAVFVAAGLMVVAWLGLGIVAGCLVLLSGGAVGFVSVVLRMRRLAPFVPDWRVWGAGVAIAVLGLSAAVAGLNGPVGLSWEKAVVAVLSGAVFLGYVRLVLTGNLSLQRLFGSQLKEQVIVE